MTVHGVDELRQLYSVEERKKMLAQFLAGREQFEDRSDERARRTLQRRNLALSLQADGVDPSTITADAG